MNNAKVTAAKEALNHITDGSILGMGSGSTVDCLINVLGESGIKLAGAVASSEKTAAQLNAIGIDVLDLNSTGTLDLYIDGADEANPALELIKGGGGALTREKIIASASKGWCAYPGKNHCQREQRISVYCRCKQTSGCTGLISATGGSNSNGAQFRC